MSNANVIQQYSLKLPEPEAGPQVETQCQTQNGVITLKSIREAKVLERIEERVRSSGVFTD